MRRNSGTRCACEALTARELRFQVGDGIFRPAAPGRAHCSWAQGFLLGLAMANASLKSSASSSPKPLRASGPSIELSSWPKAQLSLSSGSPRSGASASSEKQQGRLSPNPRSREASLGRSPQAASATSSDRGLLESSDQSSTSPSRRASLRSDDCSSHSDCLSRSTDGKSPRKASLAVTPLEGRVFGEEKWCEEFYRSWR